VIRDGIAINTHLGCHDPNLRRTHGIPDQKIQFNSTSNAMVAATATSSILARLLFQNWRRPEVLPLKPLRARFVFKTPPVRWPGLASTKSFAALSGDETA
jgi:hypothetical protein